MKKLLTLTLALLLLLCLLAPTASFAAEEETITKEEAEELYCGLGNIYKLLSYMFVKDSQAEKIWEKYESSSEVFSLSPLKEDYNTVEKLVTFAEKTLVHSLAKDVLKVCDHPDLYTVRNGVLYAWNIPWAPYSYGFFDAEDVAYAECKILSGDRNTATIQVKMENYYNPIVAEIECVKTSDGWRISGGPLMEEMYADKVIPSDIPQTADPIDPTTVALWASIAVFSLAAVTVALHQKKRVMG